MFKLNPRLVRQVVCGVDWGFTNPGTLEAFAVDGDGRMYHIYEVYHTGQLIAWWVEKALILKKVWPAVIFSCDPSEPAYIRQFNQAGLRAVEAFNEIAPGIQAVAKRLALASDGRPRLYLSEAVLYAPDPVLVDEHRPTRVTQEIEEYVWAPVAPGRKAKEVPVDENNHGLDGVRYAVAYQDNLGAKRVPFRGTVAGSRGDVGAYKPR